MVLLVVDVRDGHLDLAVSNRTDGTVTVLLGDGQGNFTRSSTTSVLSSFCNHSDSLNTCQRKRDKPTLTPFYIFWQQ